MLNIVTPFSSISQETAPFSLFGNRGIIHGEGQIVRNSRTDGWIYCPTSALTDPRQFMRPSKYTELFFLDEATALAAGHRPCGRCNHARSKEFYAAWSIAHDVENPTADEVDRKLQEARVDKSGRQLTYEADVDSLPTGVMIRASGHAQPLLLFKAENPRIETCVYPWTSHGYGIKRDKPKGSVEVLTPLPIVEVIEAGFTPGPTHPLLAW